MNEKEKFSFHAPGHEYRKWLERKEKYYGIDVKDEFVSWFRRQDRLMVSKYGCKRCPHRGTSLCPYGVGVKRVQDKGVPMKFGEVSHGSEGLPSSQHYVELQHMEDGICQERVRELSFFAKNITTVNGLLSERAENMYQMKELLAKIADIVKKSEEKQEDMTFETPDCFTIS